MINEVVLEGIVVKTWKYAEDLLFRLACYRDPDLPSKSLNDTPGCCGFRHHPRAQGQPGRAGGGRERLSRAGARFPAEPGLRRKPGGFPERCPRRRAAGSGKPGSDLTCALPAAPRRVIARRIMSQRNGLKR